jgi:predicted transposase YdaD
MPTLADRLRAEGRREAYEKSVKAGEMIAARRIAKKMLEDNMSVEFVMKITKLSEEEVKALMK